MSMKMIAINHFEYRKEKVVGIYDNSISDRILRAALSKQDYYGRKYNADLPLGRTASR